MDTRYDSDELQSIISRALELDAHERTTSGSDEAGIDRFDESDLDRSSDNR